MTKIDPSSGLICLVGDISVEWFTKSNQIRMVNGKLREVNGKKVLQLW